MKSEEIGYWWLGENIVNQKGELKSKFWWAICKKTRKVALVGVLPMYPMLIQSTHISDNKCFDGDSCLNVDCKYATSKKLIDAIHKSSFADVVDDEEQLVKFFEKAFNDIDGWFEGMDESELTEHFEKALNQITISEEALEGVLNEE